MAITVYTKPECVQCEYTKRELNRKGLEYKEIDVTQDKAGFEAVTAMGYGSLPVVVAGSEKWSGFHIDKLRDLTQDS